MQKCEWWSASANFLRCVIPSCGPSEWKMKDSLWYSWHQITRLSLTYIRLNGNLNSITFTFNRRRLARSRLPLIVSYARKDQLPPSYRLSGTAYGSERPEVLAEFFSSNINEVCIWRTWRVCIQVELVTGGLSPVCASCFTTSRPLCPPSRPCRDSVHRARPMSSSPPPPSVGWSVGRLWALTILYDAEVRAP